jgi:diguanylate cyclase (GGDEF)-like protein/PAS domain S-box-containing protein
LNVFRQEEAGVPDVAALRMREATIAAGIWLTLGIGVLGEFYVAFTWQRPHRTELTLLFALAVAAAILVWLLPRERIVRSRWREPFFLSWTLLDFVMLAVGTLADGGTGSPLVLAFFIPVVFSSMSYPLGSVVAVGMLSVLSYLALALAEGGSSDEYEAAFAAALLCTAAMSAWQATNHKRQHRALVTASRTDPLTGCLNRRGFQERALAQLEAMRRHARRGAIVVLDVDNFKPVNDVFGHAAGDELLCWVAKTLEGAVRPTDAVGRIGGDEFAIFLSDLDNVQARASVERIDEALRERAPASLGLASFPDDALELEELTRRADLRLYASRRARRQGAAAEADLTANTQAPARARSFGPADLWRATLDAMPLRSDGTRRGRQTNLQDALLDQIDASVIVTDMAGLVISWNSGAEALYGWSGEEAVGRNARELVVPEDPQEAEQLMLNLSRDGHWDGELLVRRKDRSLFTAYVRNRLICDEEGNPSAIVGVAVDISARVAAEEERHRDAEALACLDRVEDALAEDRLVLHAQPIVDLRTGQTVQQELLLRMREPDGRIVAPGEFLPVAEKYALIGEIDRWVIKQATKLAGGGCPVQANISARSVGDPDVLAHIERCVRQSRVAPGKLVFEITETAILEDQQAAQTFAERLRDLGCKLALDDFGTGYGTLTYLKRIPVDFIKLDIEFVRDLLSSSASQHVVQAVVGLARDFGVQTVAEGVEDAETLNLLARFGVDFAQGFHIARPEPFLDRPGDLSTPDPAYPPALPRAASQRPASRQLTSVGRARR